MFMKKIFIIAGSLTAIVLMIILFILLALWLAFGGASYFIPIPKPEITYGEFPFKLTYELDGEIKTIEDTIICEFDGFEVVGEAGKYRKWKIYTKSTGERMISLFDLRSNNTFTEWGQKVLELCFDPGSAEYYMGDVGNRQSAGNLCKWIDYLYILPDGKTGYSAFKLDEAWEKFKIKLISWEVSPPIQNSFK